MNDLYLEGCFYMLLLCYLYLFIRFFFGYFKKFFNIKFSILVFVCFVKMNLVNIGVLN